MRNPYTLKDLKKLVVVTAIGIGALVVVNRYEELNQGYVCGKTAFKVVGGDTLWDIAHDNCEGNLVGVIDELVETYGEHLSIGNYIYLPSHNGCDLNLTKDGNVYEECD